MKSSLVNLCQVEGVPHQLAAYACCQLTQWLCHWSPAKVQDLVQLVGYWLAQTPQKKMA